MSRKMVVQAEDGTRPVLIQCLADNEAQLQNLLMQNPDLLPLDDFELSGPLLVVGRETSLPSGSVDLLAMTRSADLLIVEFKTGPDNSDFRKALAQLLDYGSDLWEMTYEEFEQTVPVRYFGHPSCADTRLRSKRSLLEAARAVWTDVTAEEETEFRERLSRRLSRGEFHFVLVAQRFTPPSEQTIRYLNATSSAARFYAVELLRFTGGALSAYLSRPVVHPDNRSRAATASKTLQDGEFLEQFPDAATRDAVEALLEVCRGLGLRLDFGTASVAIKLPVRDPSPPLSVVRLFLPGRAAGGLKGLLFGLDPGRAQKAPSVKDALESYETALNALEGGEPIQDKVMRGRSIPPKVLVEHREDIFEILAELVRCANS